jgi:5-phospho-D-xylono-1,4-lactonase
MWEAAIEARGDTGALLLIHTERGACVEQLLAWLLARGVPAERVYLCHVDKRPDHALHAELAASGALLGFDTLVRPRYRPEATSWPLLERLVADGYVGSVALGLDLAEARMWRGPSTRAGPSALVGHVERGLQRRGFAARDVDALLGGNLLTRAALADCPLDTSRLGPTDTPALPGAPPR